jgi:Phosphate-selective porin O and P
MRKAILIILFFLLPFMLYAGDRGSSNPFVQSIMNPDISLIVDGSLVKSNNGDSDRALFSVPGFLDTVDSDGLNNGFNFNYAELGISSTVDPYFDLSAVITFSSGNVEVEEAYVNTRGLPHGFNIRFGKFKSAFGRINEQHAHYWDFYDIPLVYETMLGKEGVASPGARIYWTAPTNIFLMLGAEVMQGSFDENPTFGNEGFTVGDIEEVTSAAKPSLYTAYIKSSVDYGKSVFLFGSSLFYGATRLHDDSEALSANGTTVIDLEFTYKYLISSYRSISIQSELLKRNVSGISYSIDEFNTLDKNPVNKANAGLYTQIVWRFDTHGRWRTGFRYDLLFQNKTELQGAAMILPDNLARYTTMLEFNPTEFSRFRIQYCYDTSRYIGMQKMKNHEFIVQCNFSIGAHGAHKF